MERMVIVPAILIYNQMRNLAPHRSPELLLQEVTDDFAYVVNCSFPNSFRLLNVHQYKILQAVNGIDSVSAIASRLQIPLEIVEKFLSMLQKTEIIRFDNQFLTPQKPEQINSLNFWVHTTNACNLGCSYCYISTLNTSGGMKDDVREQLLKKLVEVAINNGIRHVRLRLAGGEPLVQFNVWKEFIPKAKRSLVAVGCKFDVGFVTNLTILNDEIIEFAKNNNIGFAVSLDGVEAIHDKTRSFRSGCGSFGIVDANLQKLIENGITVSVNTVLTNLNLVGLPDLTRYLISLNIPFRYSIVKGVSISPELLDNCLAESYNIMAEAIERGWQFSRRYQFCDLKPNELGFQTCASGFSGGAIYVDGTFNYCHVHFGDDRHTSRQSIFNDQASLIDMIDKGGHYEEEKSEDCKKCRYRSVCTSGCPVYRVDGKDPQCSLYHRFIPKYHELQAYERLRLLHV